MLQTRGRMLAPNLMSVSQLRLSLSGFPEGTAEAPSGPSSRKDRDEGRRSPLSGCTSGSPVGRRPASAPKDENDGPVRRDGRVFYRSTEATSKTHAAGRVLPFAVPLAWKPVVLAGRRKSGPASQVRRRAALSRSCARDGAEILERLGGMTPSCLKRLLTRAGKRWKTKKEEAMDREAETGEAVRRLARRGSASPRRGQGGVPGVQRNGQWRRRHSPETLSFGPETGKTTALLAAEVARKVRPDAGRRRRARQLDVSRKAPARRAGSRLLSRLRTSRRSCRPSRPTGTTAPRDAADGVDKVIRALPPRQGDDENGGS